MSENGGRITRKTEKTKGKNTDKHDVRVHLLDEANPLTWPVQASGSVKEMPLEGNAFDNAEFQSRFRLLLILRRGCTQQEVHA